MKPRIERLNAMRQSSVNLMIALFISLGLATASGPHPGEFAARKQLEGQNRSDALSTAVAAPRSSPPSHASRWLPPDVDENVPPVEPGSTCNPEEVLQKAGQKIQEFVKDVERFTATEYLLHESINKSGEVSKRQNRKYDYMVSIEEIQPGILGVEEYQNSSVFPDGSPAGVITRGLPALVLIFHPYVAENFSMRCEGLATFNGKRVWQIYFRQREDKPNRIRAYRSGVNESSHRVDLKGRAWFDADSYQILGLQTDLMRALPDIRLTVDHAAVEYGPVHFVSRGVDMWLPQTAEVYLEWRDRRIHQRLNFNNYFLFAVDVKQRISSPKMSP